VHPHKVACSGVCFSVCTVLACMSMHSCLNGMPAVGTARAQLHGAPRGGNHPSRLSCAAPSSAVCTKHASHRCRAQSRCGHCHSLVAHGEQRGRPALEEPPRVLVGRHIVLRARARARASPAREPPRAPCQVYQRAAVQRERRSARPPHRSPPGPRPAGGRAPWWAASAGRTPGSAGTRARRRASARPGRTA